MPYKQKARFTLHGNYCGPGNKMEGKAKDEFDQYCRWHDMEYGRLGPKAYLNWNSADHKFVKRLEGMIKRDKTGEKPLSRLTRNKIKHSVSYFKAKWAGNRLFGVSELRTKGKRKSQTPLGTQFGKRIYAPPRQQTLKRKRPAGQSEAGRAKRALPSNEQKEDHLNSMVYNGRGRNYNSAATAVRVNKKRKRKKSKRPMRMPPKLRKSIRRIAKSSDYVLVNCNQATVFGAFHANYNAVSHTVATPNFGQSVQIQDREWTIADPQNRGAEVVMSLDNAAGSHGYLGQKAKFDWTKTFKLTNNSNGQFELIFYNMESLDYHSTTAVSDMENLRNAKYNNGPLPANANEDFTQYMTVSGQKSKLWKIAEKKSVNMKPGEQATVSLSGRKTLMDFNRWIKEGETTYIPGERQIVVRMVGRITHSKEETTTGNLIHPHRYDNQVVQGGQIDYMADERCKLWVKDANRPTQIYTQTAIFGLPAIAETAFDLPVYADNQQPEVAGYDAA
jgi:hypothetical protein